MVTKLLVLALFAAGGAESRAAEAVHAALNHRPPTNAEASKNLPLTAELEAGWAVESADVMYRRIGATEWKALPLLRSSAGGYATEVPGGEVDAPGVEYYIRTRDKEGHEALRFGSPEKPHPVLVRGDVEARKGAARLAAHDGKRVEVSLHGEAVNFGHGAMVYRGSGTTSDAYYRIESDVLYRVLTRFESFRFGMGSWRGSLPTSEGNDPTLPNQTGIDYGFTELSALLGDLIGVRAKIAFGANKGGAQVGGGGALRIGTEAGAHTEIGFEAFGGIGYSAFLKLAWDTVPTVPMAATIELTNFPRADARPAVRMVVEARHPLTKHLSLSMRAGYQGRDSLSGGATLGAGTHYEF